MNNAHCDRRQWLPRLIVLIVLAAAALPTAPALAGTITTGPPTATISSFGYPNTATYGETIVGNGHALVSFTFTFTLPATTNFQPAVYTWTGTQAGTQVWLGATTAPCGCGQETMTFTLPSGVVLQNGQQYILLMTTLANTGSGTGNFASTDNSAYPNGDFRFQNGTAGQPLSTLSGGGWGNIASDLAFTAVFTDDQPMRVMVCTTAPHARVGATAGTFFDVTADEWVAGATDSTSILYQATPAIFVQGYGATCLLSDIVSWGGDPSLYAAAGVNVNAVGIKAPAGITDADWGALYPYYPRK